MNEIDYEMTLSQASEYMGITRQAMYVAILNGRVECKQFENGRYSIKRSALEKYKASKYDRRLTFRHNGEQILKPGSGLVNTAMAANIIGIPTQALYYFVRKGALPYELAGKQYIFRLRDIEAFAQEYWKKEQEAMG